MSMYLTCLSCSFPAWELFYGIVIPSTPFERLNFLIWFITDILFVAAVIFYGHATNRMAIASKVLLSNLILFSLYWPMSALFPDHHATAYFTGFRDQILVTWGSIYEMARSKSTRGHSLEIW